MSAHPNSPPIEPPPSAIVSHLHHIGHVVRDIDAAIRLYRRMGFVVPPPSFPALALGSGGRPRAFGVGNTHVTLRHSFVELVTVADDRHGGPVGAEATLVPLQAPPEILDRLTVERTADRLSTALARFESWGSECRSMAPETNGSRCGPGPVRSFEGAWRHGESCPD